MSDHVSDAIKDRLIYIRNKENAKEGFAGRTTREIADMIGISLSAARRRLKGLEESGAVASYSIEGHSGKFWQAR